MGPDTAAPVHHSRWISPVTPIVGMATAPQHSFLCSIPAWALVKC